MRIGRWIGGFFVSTAVNLGTSPLWWMIVCISIAFYLLFWVGTIPALFLAGYLLFLAAVPQITLTITLVVVVLLIVAYVNIHFL